MHAHHEPYHLLHLSHDVSALSYIQSNSSSRLQRFIQLRQLSAISSSQTSNDVLFSCYRVVFTRIRCTNTTWKGFDRRVEIGVAKEGNRLTGGGHAFRVADLLCRWGHHLMESGAEYIIAPTR